MSNPALMRMTFARNMNFTKINPNTPKMIPQERVNEAAETNCHYPDRMMFKIGFAAGVRFAEAEPQTFEIDFCGHVKAKVEFKDGKLNIIAAMNGYGEALDPNQITITPIGK